MCGECLLTIIPVLTFLPPDSGSWTAGPVPLHLFPGSVAGARTPRELRACHGIDGLVGAGQPAGVLPKPQLFLPSLLETGQDRTSSVSTLLWFGSRHPQPPFSQVSPFICLRGD